MKSKTLTVRTKDASYPILIGRDLRSAIVRMVRSEGKQVAVISDTTVARIFGRDFLSLLRKGGVKSELFTFGAGEKNKNQHTVTALQNKMLKKKFGRDSLVVALGGGVVGDVAGFVAATYMRGIPYIQVPTTLLAMVDSSIGGKVGINTPFGKNTVGAFWQPRAVIMDLDTLAHLPRKEFVNGLFEAIKTFFTSDARMLTRIGQLNLDSPLKTANALESVIHRSVSIKAGIVGRDERESGERLVVNFGHTVGHAIELLSKFKIPHGYAVGYGMLVESKICELLGTISSKEFSMIRAHLKRLGITAKPLSKFPISRVLNVAKTDKKSKGGKPHYVLLSGIGSVHKKNGVYAHPVKDAIVKKAFEHLKG